MASHRWAFSLALLFVLLISPLISSVVNPYRVTVGFGLDAVGCGLLILAARDPLTAGARRWASDLSGLRAKQLFSRSTL